MPDILILSVLTSPNAFARDSTDGKSCISETRRSKIELEVSSTRDASRSLVSGYSLVLDSINTDIQHSIIFSIDSDSRLADGEKSGAKIPLQLLDKNKATI